MRLGAAGMKTLNWILNIIMGTIVGVFIGHGIYVYWDFKTHPDLYAAWSAPWYTSILVAGIEAGIVLLIAVILKLIVRRKLKNKQ